MKALTVIKHHTKIAEDLIPPFAVIFDMDGVIVNSNPFHKIALKQFCEKHGYHLSDEELKSRIFGRTNKDWLMSLFDGKVTAKQIKEFENEKESLFREIFTPHIKPVKGLITFLERLKARQIPRAIATSAPPANVQFTLGKTKTRKFFQAVVDGDEVENSKPHPEIYEKTAAAIHFPPQKCVIIEDSLSGIAAGRQAGCKVIGITTTHTHDELVDTDLVIDDFDQLTVDHLIKLF
jgi:HAD superfamily hydrolase (TIGR01509 family)